MRLYSRHPFNPVYFIYKNFGMLFEIWWHMVTFFWWVAVNSLDQWAGKEDGQLQTQEEHYCIICLVIGSLLLSHSNCTNQEYLLEPINNFGHFSLIPITNRTNQEYPSELINNFGHFSLFTNYRENGTPWPRKWNFSMLFIIFFHLCAIDLKGV